MSYVNASPWRKFFLLMLVAFCTGQCSNLMPDGTDERSRNPSGILSVGQIAPEFSLPVTDGSTLTRASGLAGKNGLVFYFTMWCPVCTSHTDEIVQAVMPAYPNARFVVVDYVSASLGEAATLKTYGGYDATGILVVLDSSQSFMKSYAATMAYVIVIDSAGVIRMNEVYKRPKLEQILGSL